MTTSSCTVALIEDDPSMRSYLEECIGSCIELSLLASFASLSPAREWLTDHTVDVVLTDLALPDGHALPLIRDLAARQPQCQILVVSVFGDEDNVLACVEAGAVGYILKDSRSDDIAQTILDVRRGASPISPMVARKLLARLRKPLSQVTNAPSQSGEKNDSALTPLSPREMGVLDLISRGYSYAEIAGLQGISLHTVQSHVRNLYSKLAVHSRSEAVFEASRLGMLPQFLRERDSLG